jgi:uncharacterized protein YbjT (DUF2867 family)
MKIMVMGATGGTGRVVVDELLRRDHQVTAFARQTARLGHVATPARRVDGDATDAAAVAGAVDGQDAVIVTLGIAEPAVRVRVRGPRHTTSDIRSIGTGTVIAAMQQHGVRRLVVQSTYGVGESRDRLRRIERAFFRLVLRPQIEDTERQEAAVRASGLDWTIVQPVHLTDDASTGPIHLSTSSEVDGMRVSRRAVATVLAGAAEGAHPNRRTIAVSGTSATSGSPRRADAAGARRRLVPRS